MAATQTPPVALDSVTQSLQGASTGYSGSYGPSPVSLGLPSSSVASMQHQQHQQQGVGLSGSYHTLPSLAQFVPTDDNSGTLPTTVQSSAMVTLPGFVPVAPPAAVHPVAAAAPSVADEGLWGKALQGSAGHSGRLGGLVREGATGSGSFASSLWGTAPNAAGAHPAVAAGLQLLSSSTQELEQLLVPPVCREGSGTGSTDQSFLMLLTEALGLPPLTQQPPQQQQQQQEDGGGGHRIGSRSSAFAPIGTGGGFKPYRP